jgi:transaldolase
MRISCRSCAVEEAILASGTIQHRHIGEDVDGARQTFQAFADAGIDYDDVVDTLEREGVEKFAKSFRQLFADVEAKRDALVAA